MDSFLSKNPIAANVDSFLRKTKGPDPSIAARAADPTTFAPIGQGEIVANQIAAHREGSTLRPQPESGSEAASRLAAVAAGKIGAGFNNTLSAVDNLGNPIRFIPGLPGDTPIDTTNYYDQQSQALSQAAHTAAIEGQTSNKVVGVPSDIVGALPGFIGAGRAADAISGASKVAQAARGVATFSGGSAAAAPAGHRGEAAITGAVIGAVLAPLSPLASTIASKFGPEVGAAVDQFVRRVGSAGVFGSAMALQGGSPEDIAINAGIGGILPIEKNAKTGEPKPLDVPVKQPEPVAEIPKSPEKAAVDSFLEKISGSNVQPGPQESPDTFAARMEDKYGPAWGVDSIHYELADRSNNDTAKAILEQHYAPEDLQRALDIRKEARNIPSVENAPQQAAPEAKVIDITQPEAPAESATPDAAKPESVVSENAQARPAIDSESRTSMRKAMMNEDRAAMNLVDLPASEKTTFAAELQKAREQGVPERAHRIVAEVNANPREMSTVESAGVTQYMAKLKNEHATLTEKVNDPATPEPDRLSADAEKVRIEQEYADASQAAAHAKSTSGLNLKFTQLTLDKDYSLLSMKTRARTAKGSDLTPEESSQIEALSKKLAEAEAKITAQENDTREATLKAAHEAIVGSAKLPKIPRERPAAKGYGSRNKLVTKVEADEALEFIKASFNRLSANPGLDPALAAALIKRGVYHIEANTREFAAWSKTMLEELGDKVKPHLEDLWRQANSQYHGEQRKDIISNAAEKLKAGDTPDMGVLAQKLARGFVAEGITERGPLVEAVHKELKQIEPEISERDTADAISGYGKYKQLSKDDVSIQLRDLKGQLQQVSKLEDMQAKIAPAKTGIERRTPSSEERSLIKQVEEAKRKGGYKIENPEQQLKSALDSVKTRLRNDIESLTDQINSGQKTVNGKTEIVYDAEAVSLKSRRDTLKEQFDSIFGKETPKGMTDEQRIKMATAAVEKSISEIDRRIKTGDLFPGKKPSKTPQAPELLALRAKRTAMQEELKLLQKTARPGRSEEQVLEQALNKSIEEYTRKIAENDLDAPIGKSTVDTKTVADLKASRDDLRKKLEDMRKASGFGDQAKLEAATESAKTSIEKLKAKISANDLAVSKKSEASDPALKALREEQKDLTKILLKMRAAARPKKSAAEVALQAYKTRTATRIADLQGRIARGDFDPRPRKPVALDSAAEQAKANAEKLKRQFDILLAKKKLADRAPFEKVQDTFLKWRRGFILSSPVVLAKLTSAAAQRMIFTPVEELIGAGYSSLLPDVASRAPRQGGFSLEAESKSITQGFTQGMKDAWDTMKSGGSNLDALYGGKLDIDPSIIDVIGHIHGALKAPVKRAEFSRSFQKRTEFAIRNGLDPRDPATQSEIAIAAYKDANRAIFQQDNIVATAWNRALNALEQKDKTTGHPSVAGKTLATVGRTLLPIVKIPTNIVAETFEYVLGTFTGSARLAHAYSKGIESLAPEQADIILRQLKKGTLGAAGLALGYFLRDQIGGYYHGKRDAKDVKPGHMNVAGVDIPSYLLHNPLTETLQIGADVARVSDSLVKKSDPEKKGMATGVGMAILGLIEQIPFVREMTDVGGLYGGQPGRVIGDEARSLAIPQVLQWTARQFDKGSDGEPIKRDTSSVIKNVESGIPYLRNQLPAAKVNGRSSSIPLTEEQKAKIRALGAR